MRCSAFGERSGGKLASVGAGCAPCLRAAPPAAAGWPSCPACQQSLRRPPWPSAAAHRQTWVGWRPGAGSARTARVQAASPSTHCHYCSTQNPAHGGRHPGARRGAQHPPAAGSWTTACPPAAPPASAGWPASGPTGWPRPQPRCAPGHPCRGTQGREHKVAGGRAGGGGDRRERLALVASQGCSPGPQPD